MDGYERCATPDSSAEAHALWTTRKQQYRVSELVAFIKSYLLPEPAPDRPYVHPAQYKVSRDMTLLPITCVVPCRSWLCLS